jgi:1,4-dihydroxy-2-naphthoyl-CoA hydrolase
MSRTDTPKPAAPPDDLAEALNAASDGWNKAMGLHFVRATADEVIAEIVVGPVHKQPYGIVHGGVHAGVIEAVTSTGAALHALPSGKSVVGLENSTSFIRAVREGTLRIRATPITRGRRTQVWDATVTDAEGRTVATGRVRLLALDPESALAGEAVQVTPSPR